MSASALPILGISMDDPAGIGPEIIVKALARDQIRILCRPLVIGDASVIANACRVLGSKLKVHPIADAENATFDLGEIDVVDLKNVDLARLELGQVSAMAGNAAFEAIRTMIELAKARKIAATVTAPIHKE